MSGAQQLAEDLRRRGYDVEVRNVGGVDYVIAKNFIILFGRFQGQVIQLALPGPPDYPVTPPGGIHTNPRIVPTGTNNIHDSPLGSDWCYWSRPIPDWPKARTTARIMSHINTLFERAQ